jgi:hypothetical protein
LARHPLTRKPATLKRIVILLSLILVVAWVRNYLESNQAAEEKAPSGSPTVEEVFTDRVSGIMIETSGRVDRILPDDNEGSRHQRFILKVPSGHTVLISHNIDLASRVPVETGDRVTIFGQYEWNDRGGVLHWTHHDPAGRHEEGWIDHEGTRYQ